MARKREGERERRKGWKKQNPPICCCWFVARFHICTPLSHPPTKTELPSPFHAEQSTGFVRFTPAFGRTWPLCGWTSQQRHCPLHEVATRKLAVGLNASELTPSDAAREACAGRRVSERRVELSSGCSERVFSTVLTVCTPSTYVAAGLQCPYSDCGPASPPQSPQTTWLSNLKFGFPPPV